MNVLENSLALWQAHLPHLANDTNKYRRGHVAVFSGGITSTGAARLAALAAMRIGAGVVTLLSPPDAVAVNAAHLTSIMLRETRTMKDVSAFIAARKVNTAVLGPGYGNLAGAREIALTLLKTSGHFNGLVLDADGLIAFEEFKQSLFLSKRGEGTSLVLTPHEGEFQRLFGQIAADKTLSKPDKARIAAKLAQAVVVYKGPDTVIAAPDGRAAINMNGTALLATAGSGDVLAGMIAGLLGQGMPAFEASCAAVWMHSDAARRFGPALIAEDLPAQLPAVLLKVQN